MNKEISMSVDTYLDVLKKVEVAVICQLSKKYDIYAEDAEEKFLVLINDYRARHNMCPIYRFDKDIADKVFKDFPPHRLLELGASYGWWADDSENCFFTYDDAKDNGDTLTYAIESFMIDEAFDFVHEIFEKDKDKMSELERMFAEAFVEEMKKIEKDDLEK